MRAVIYARVSSDPHGLGRSTTEQVDECLRICEREGWEVVETLVDNDIGASRWSGKERPGYARLAELIASGVIDVAVTWEASRAQRDLQVYVEMRRLCQDYNVLWSYSGRVYDLQRTDDAFSTGLDALLAEREASVTRDRVLRSVRARASQGLPHGIVPYGYRRIYDDRTGQLLEQVPDPETAPIVQEIFERVDAGESIGSVVRSLNERGIPPARGKQWRSVSVRKMCRNPTYIGKRTHRGEVVADGAWEPLVSEDVHFRLVAKLKDPQRRNSKSSKIKHFLSGIARCGVCDTALSARVIGGYPTYVCMNGGHVSRSQKRLDTYIDEVVKARLSQPDVQILSGATQELREALREVAQLRARLEEFYEAAARGELTPAGLAKVEARLTDQIALQEARASAQGGSGALQALGGSDAAKVWSSRPLEARREIVRALMAIRVHPTKSTGRAPFDPSAVEVVWLDVGKQPSE